jgi:hypothetical protein
MDFVAAKPAIIIPATRELLKLDRRLILPAISFISSGRFGSGTPAPSNTFTDSVVDATNLTTYTFTSRAIGAVDSTRRVVVGVAWGNSIARTLSSATIGGVGATIHVQTGAGNLDGSALISAAVPTGTTATIVVTLTAGALNCGIAVWSLLNATGSPSATASDNTTSADALSVGVNVPANGSLFCICAMVGSGAGRTFTWTNATERVDAPLEVSDVYSAASETGLGVETPRTITATASASVIGGSLCLMTWN